MNCINCFSFGYVFHWFSTSLPYHLSHVFIAFIILFYVLVTCFVVYNLVIVINDHISSFIGNLVIDDKELSSGTNAKIQTLKRIKKTYLVIVGSWFSDWAPWNGWDPGPMDPLQWIFREWVQGLGFDETTVNARVGDDRVGAKSTEVDGLTIRRNELLVRRNEFPSGLIHQEHEGGIYALSLPGSKKPPPPYWGRSLPFFF